MLPPSPRLDCVQRTDVTLLLMKNKSVFRLEKFESHRLNFTSQNGDANSFKVGNEPAAGESRRHTCTQSARLYVGMLSHYVEYR